MGSPWGEYAIDDVTLVEMTGQTVACVHHEGYAVACGAEIDQAAERILC